MTSSSKQQPNFEFIELTNFHVTVSPHFTQWLAEQQVSLMFTNTLGNRLFIIGLKPDGRLWICERHFDRCMGLVADNTNRLYMVTRYQIWRLENALPPGQLTDTGYDRLYIPQMAHTTGSINIHDIAVDNDGQVIFVNTRFGCLATLSKHDNFVPLWKPPFLPELTPDDRCHLNGLAMREGKPAYVTSFSQTADEFEGWRKVKENSGTVTDVATNEVILSGLCMPHSPRFYQGQLWLTNSGAGEFGRIDLARGQYEPIAFAPGFLRGLAFQGDFAIVGSSKPRHADFFNGLPLHNKLDNYKLKSVRGLFIVDLRTGEVAHWLNLAGGSGEIYDVVALPQVLRPMVLDLGSEEIQTMVTVGPAETLEPAQ
ncbi:MAG: TIGR03032 family protein [Desulfocapsaceae bacterium]|nr:TIGR03032 family protein [Desulfocapsaceae bacterium]